MKEFGKLPNDPVIRDMSELDYLYCKINMLLDDAVDCEYSVNESFNIKEYKRKRGVY